jgi:hypothetical protein
MKTVPHTNTFKLSEVREVVNPAYYKLVDLFGYALYTLPSKYQDSALWNATHLSAFRNYGIVEPDVSALDNNNGFMYLADPGMLRINPKTISVQITLHANVNISLGWDNYGSGNASIELFKNGVSIGSCAADAWIQRDDQWPYSETGAPTAHPGWNYSTSVVNVTGLTYYDTLTWSVSMTSGQSGQGQDNTTSAGLTVGTITLTSGDTGTRIIPKYKYWDLSDSGVPTLTISE